ncbi:MAG: hypothetical protein JST66_04065 [Bacteroidetes bacterium]|nr:hypothetical protein [Bacteroidota bacterium]
MDTPLPGAYELGQRFGAWVASLDLHDGPLHWPLLRLDEAVQAEPQRDLRELHTYVQRMRNAVVPWIKVGQVQALDRMLADPLWVDRNARMLEFRNGFFARRTASPIERLMPA